MRLVQKVVGIKGSCLCCMNMYKYWCKNCKKGFWCRNLLVSKAFGLQRFWCTRLVVQNILSGGLVVASSEKKKNYDVDVFREKQIVACNIMMKLYIYIRG